METQKGGKALILSPAGRVYGGDNVEWYEQPQAQIEQTYFNIGDMVVYDSTLKILDLSEVRGVQIEHPTDWEIAQYQNFDFFLVRASNFIHNDMKWHDAISIFDRVQLPIYAIGVGGQASGRDKYTLTGENLRFWKIVSERSKLIGVRGNFTADLLCANGIKNVEVVGCPSIFRARKRDLRIEKPANIERLAFSIRREVDGTYSAAIDEYRSVQRDLLLECARKYDVRVTVHGEPEEKAFFYRNLELMKKAREVFFHEKWWTAETRVEMEELYRDKLFFFLRVAEYDAFIKGQDIALGYRVHGVLPALANGVPGILVKYDSRSTELANTHAIPSVDLSELKNLSVDAVLDSVDFSEFNRLFDARYDKMRFVLEQNGLPHRL